MTTQSMNIAGDDGNNLVNGAIGNSGGGGGGVSGGSMAINSLNGKNSATAVVISNLKQFGTCEICGDRGSGYHYSIYSCEGCKGFFKRTVQKDLQYKCREYQQCVINKQTRNQCQFCRFQKCLMSGMKRDAVREDRTPSKRSEFEFM